jgi:hypothetical protein
MRKDGELVLPLRAGHNFVGRGFPSDAPYQRLPTSPVVEQVQWFIACEAGEALVVDAGSTNLSVLVPGAAASLAEELPHWNALVPRPEGSGAVAFALREHGRPLREGDVLRSVYASFVFGWVEGAATD